VIVAESRGIDCYCGVLGIKSERNPVDTRFTREVFAYNRTGLEVHPEREGNVAI
jgi:hypothetical protein